MQYNYPVADQSRLRDGSLVMKLTQAEHPDPEKLVFNPKTGGVLAAEFCYIYSDDRGTPGPIRWRPCTTNRSRRTTSPSTAAA